MNFEELSSFVKSIGEPSFRAKQIAAWLPLGASVREMTNLSKAAREKLSGRYEVGVIPYAGLQVSSDGTKKYLFPVACSHKRGLNVRCSEDELETSAIEAVMIPDADRATLCVSSQAGCRMGCKFCMTGRQGFHGHMSAADIISQFIAVDESDKLTNAVFMGMGEPLDNYDNVMRAIEILTADWGFAWSPKRITLSTIGVLPNLKRYLDECKCHLAVSLHNPVPEERLSVMPVQGAWPIQDVIDLIKQYDFSGQRRVSFEYTMFAGFNDTKVHADALVRMLRGLECRMNLIRFHKIPDFPYETSPGVIIENFKQRLNNAGITTTLRASRGEDILAACGMLAGEHAKNNA